MSNSYRALCAELLVDYDNFHYRSELSDRAHALLAQPEPSELTDEDLDAIERQCWIPTEAYNDAGCEYYASLRRFARAAIAADRARRPTPHSPVDGEAVEVLQWPAEWSRKQRAQEAEMLCCSAGMPPGTEMQQLVQDSRDGMPLQHLHDLISHAIPTPQPPADGEVAELVRYLKQESEEMGYQFEHEPSRKFRRAAELLQQQHPQPVAVSERPWERKGWCDEQGQCWWFDNGCWFLLSFGLGFSWGRITHCLPHYALPTPASEVKL